MADSWMGSGGPKEAVTLAIEDSAGGVFDFVDEFRWAWETEDVPAAVWKLL